jgi:hypothetical protein
MTLPAGYSARGGGRRGGAPPSSFKRGILWVGVAIIFISTILNAPPWISWFGAAMVMIGIYYMFREWFQKGRKTTAAITFGLIGAIVIGVVSFTTFSIRSAVDEQRQIDREVEATISQMSPAPDIDIGWYYDIEICLGFWEVGRHSLREVSCDARSMIEMVNSDCRVYNDAPLICNRGNFLNDKLRVYLELIS